MQFYSTIFFLFRNLFYFYSVKWYSISILLESSADLGVVIFFLIFCKFVIVSLKIDFIELKTIKLHVAN